MSRARDSFIGPYRIEVKIGDGGMGIVYKCLDPKLKRFVALKVLKEKFASDKKYIERFHREAQAIAALSHANVAQIHAIEEGNGSAPYLVMEYIDGFSAESLLAQGGKVPIQRALAIVRDAAMGLKAAFLKGIIHRDVKPSNILISSEGTVKLVDFGLAKEIQKAHSLTDEGMVVGTPHYISPEQGRGHKVDQRSDIYSLGATLYHLVTGRPPFDGDSQLAVIVAHLHQVPKPPHQIRSDAPEALSMVVGRMMAKDPTRRYADYQELIDDLNRLIRGEGIGAKTVTQGAMTFRPERQGIPAKFWWAAGAAVVLAVLTTLAVIAKILPFQPVRANQLERLGNLYIRQDASTECFDLWFNNIPPGFSPSELENLLFILSPEDSKRGLPPLGPSLKMEDLSGPLAFRFPFERLDEVHLQELRILSKNVHIGLDLIHPQGARLRRLRLALRSGPAGTVCFAAVRHNDSAPVAELAPPASLPSAGPYDLDLRLRSGEGETHVLITIQISGAKGSPLFTNEPEGLRIPGNDWQNGVLLFWGISSRGSASVEIARMLLVGHLETREGLKSFPGDI